MAAGVLPQNEQPDSASVHPTGHAADMKGGPGRPTPKYTRVGERLRHVLPGHVACSVACGGRACKYENPARWTEQEQAITGLYSSWVTESILAMARPSTELLEKYGVIEQFRSHGLKTVINLQRPGEHASCGSPLERASGFTYLPEAFMEAGIYFYNFGWKDYGVASLTTILDMVKVMTFALQEGKVAVHCHAGLGRTGVLIACYLVFATRMTADQAIVFVRAKRPNSIQTRGQLLCVREFTQFLAPLRCIFSGCDPGAHAVTLAQYLIRQRHLLHGYEARLLRHVPKIVHLVCRLLLGLAENRPVAPEDAVGAPGLSADVAKAVSEAVTVQLDTELRRRRQGASDCAAPAAGVAGPWGRDASLSGEHAVEPPWKRQNAESLQPLTRLKRQLSRSDSDLQREQSGTAWTGAAQGALGLSPRQQTPASHREVLQAPPLGFHQDALARSTGSFWSQAQLGGLGGLQDDGSPQFPRKHLAKEVQRSRTFSSGLAGPRNPGGPAAPRFADIPQEPYHSPQQGARCQCVARGACSPGRGAEDSAAHRSPRAQPSVAPEMQDSRALHAVAPQAAGPSALSVEERTVLAARALADSQESAHRDEVQRKVGVWQEELNSRDGAWERICGEKDPFVLCALMWSWVAQLKEPVITPGDVDMLVARRPEPAEALSLLEKDQHQTVLCVLHCAASLRTVPADLEEAVLAQAIRAFTKVHIDSEKGPVVYDTLKKIFKHTLEEQRKGTRDSPPPAVQCG